MQDIFSIKNCPIDFYCSKIWDELVDTEKAGIKFCHDFKKEVTFCSTMKEFEESSKPGLCVALLACYHAETEEWRNHKWDVTLGLPSRK
jgi:hypothetical protein